MKIIGGNIVTGPYGISQNNLPVSTSQSSTSSAVSTSTPLTASMETSSSTVRIIANNDSIIVDAASTATPFPQTGMDLTTTHISSTNIGSVISTSTSATENSSYISVTSPADYISPAQTAPSISTTQNVLSTGTPNSVEDENLSSSESPINISLVGPFANVLNNSLTGPIFALDIPNINVILNMDSVIRNISFLVELLRSITTITEHTIVDNVSQRDIENLTESSVTENTDLSALNERIGFGPSSRSSSQLKNFVSEQSKTNPCEKFKFKFFF